MIREGVKVRKTGLFEKYDEFTCPHCGCVFRIPDGDRTFVNFCVDCGYAFWEDNGIPRKAAESNEKCVQELVRCKDCKYGEPMSGNVNCKKGGVFAIDIHPENWFCADGEPAVK